MLPSPLLFELLYTRASIFQPQLQPCNPPIHQTNPRTITLFSKTRGESNAAIRSMINGRIQIRGLYPFARRGKTSSRVKNPILGGSREEEKKRIPFVCTNHKQEGAEETKETENVCCRMWGAWMLCGKVYALPRSCCVGSCILFQGHAGSSLESVHS